MGSCHIAHDCKIGNNNIFANNTLFAGHVVVEVSNNFTIIAFSHQLNRETICVFKNDSFFRTVLTLQGLLLSINFVILDHTHFLVEALWYVKV